MISGAAGSPPGERMSAPGSWPSVPAAGRPLTPQRTRRSPAVCDLIVIGAGPAGAATAIQAARGGARVRLFEKASPGRDKSCGDAISSRSITDLTELGICLDSAHRINGVRLIADGMRCELLCPSDGPFAPYGAVWPRRDFDRHLAAAAEEAGAEIVWNTEAMPVLNDDGVVIGVQTASGEHRADLVALSSGAAGRAARMLGAGRVSGETFGLAIRAYVATPRHAERYMEFCYSLRDEDGAWIPGYGWIFPVGDGTVNIGVGSLSTMQGFRNLNLNRLLDAYRRSMAEEWDLGDYLEKPRAWRLPMSSARRHGQGWAATGDAAGLICPLTGEGIDYALESGVLLADLFLQDPGSAAEAYDRAIGERFDAFLRAGRRFGAMIGQPLGLPDWLLDAACARTRAEFTLKVIASLADVKSQNLANLALHAADKGIGWNHPLMMRRTRTAT